MFEKRLGLLGLVGLLSVGLLSCGFKPTRPSVLDILGDTQAQVESSAEPAIETVDPVADLEKKLIEIDRRLGSYVTTLDGLQATVTAYLPPDTRVAETHSKWLEELSGQIEKIRKDQLAVMKQSEEPKNVPPDKTQLAKELTFIYGDGCQPCDQWKVGPDREQIAAECQVVPVYVNDLPPEARPESLPAYTLQIDGLRARHRGYLTFQRFKDMERAILEKRRSQ